MSEAVLRPLSEKDRETYLSMTRAFYQSDAVDHPVPETYFIRTFEAVMAGSPFVSCRVLEWNGRTVGYVLLAHTWSQEAGGETVWIEELYVLPEYRGRGFGRSAFAALKAEFSNAARFRLEVCPGNIRAQKLYSDLGYEVLDYRQMVADYG